MRNNEKAINPFGNLMQSDQKTSHFSFSFFSFQNSKNTEIAEKLTQKKTKDKNALNTYIYDAKECYSDQTA